MIKQHVLFVDDDTAILKFYSKALKSFRDIRISIASSADECLEILESQVVDLVFLDRIMPDTEGMALFTNIREVNSEVPIILMTGFPDVESAVQSMKLGALDYLVKPINPRLLTQLTRDILDKGKLESVNTLLENLVEKPQKNYPNLLGESQSFRECLDFVERLAPTDFDVLITGETGTGKEVFARAIHKRSPRQNEKFVPVDCGAIPESLFESELFGYERGAFSGATRRKIGLLEFSDKGVLFLDEIGKLSLVTQAKLLRCLQERKIRRVGGQNEFDVDVRIIAATNQDLESKVRDQLFRSDLFYRLNATHLELPPLRQRPGDVPLLVEHFLESFCKALNRNIPEIPGDVMEVLNRYNWPGNIRELQNTMRQIAVLASDKVDIEALPQTMLDADPIHFVVDPTTEGSFFEQRKTVVEKFEHDYFHALLKQHEGDTSEVAKQVEIPRGTLYRLLKKLGLQAKDYRDS